MATKKQAKPITGKYDKHVPHAFKKGTRQVVIGAMKLDRLIAKNLRRHANGLPPLESYAQA